MFNEFKKFLALPLSLKFNRLAVAGVMIGAYTISWGAQETGLIKFFIFVIGFGLMVSSIVRLSAIVLHFENSALKSKDPPSKPAPIDH